MKTKKFLFILLLIMLFGQGVIGQGYNPFPKENAFWTVIEYEEQFGMGDYSSVRLYTIEGDTVYNGITYYKIFKYYKHKTSGDTLIQLHSLMREDTLQKKVWFVRLFLNETEEKLGYDFSINIGDTVSLPALDFYCFDGQNQFLCGDSIFILDSQYQFPLYPSGDSSVGHYFISLNNNFIDLVEGIGTSFFPFPNLLYPPNYMIEPSRNSCLLIDNVVVFTATTIDDCGFFSYSIQESEIFKVEVFPNPCNEQLNLCFQNPLSEKVILELISFTGKVVYSEEIFNVETHLLGTSSFANGLYLLRLTDKQQTQTFKIIVSH